MKYIEKTKKKKDTIYVICTDLNLDEKTINKIIHARWDIENEGFNELKKMEYETLFYSKWKCDRCNFTNNNNEL